MHIRRNVESYIRSVFVYWIKNKDYIRSVSVYWMKNKGYIRSVSASVSCVLEEM